jgi:hypothetical protein
MLPKEFREYYSLLLKFPMGFEKSPSRPQRILGDLGKYSFGDLEDPASRTTSI